MKKLLVGTLALASVARAEVVWLDVQNDLDISHYVEEVATPADSFREDFHFVPKRAKPEEVVVIEEILNLGKRIWKIIEKNKPVVNVKYSYANAVPRGIGSAEELENFSPLQHRSFRMYGVNGFKATVYDVTYTLVHRYGGRYQGQGQYLDTVTVLPHKLDVLWGYTVNFGVDKISTVNVGDKKAPIASIVMELNFQVSTVIKSSQFRGLYEFRGDSARVGTIQQD